MQQGNDSKVEAKLLRNWKLRIALLTAIISPAVTGTAAYFNMKDSFKEAIRQSEQETEKKYVRKEAMESIKDDLTDVKSDVKDIKNFLINRGR